MSPSAPTATVSPTPADGERYVTIAFWNDSTCSAEPGSTHRFPDHYGDTQCHTWPGRSGENSASRFSCGSGTFSYTQWTTLTCSGGQVPAAVLGSSTVIPQTKTGRVRILAVTSKKRSAALPDVPTLRFPHASHTRGRLRP